MQFNTNGTWTEWEPFATTRTIDLPPGDGIKRVLVKYKDSAGKICRAYKDTIIVDTKAPVGKVKITAGAASTTSPNVKLTTTATGKPATMQISVDGGTTWGEWEVFTKTKAVTLPGGGGEKSVSVKLRDATGNESQPCSNSIMLVQP